MRLPTRENIEFIENNLNTIRDFEAIFGVSFEFFMQKFVVWETKQWIRYGDYIRRYYNTLLKELVIRLFFMLGEEMPKEYHSKVTYEDVEFYNIPLLIEDYVYSPRENKFYRLGFEEYQNVLDNMIPTR